MLRGINQQTIFEEDEDRHQFIKTLGYYKTISNYALHGYCLMNNHISAMQRLEKGERDAVIRKMKVMPDVSIRQLARITGISKSVIDRI